MSEQDIPCPASISGLCLAMTEGNHYWCEPEECIYASDGTGRRLPEGSTG